MINKFPGQCFRCGQRLRAAEGLYEQIRWPGELWSQAKGQRNWGLVVHRECAEKYRGTNVHYYYNPADGDEDGEVIERE